MPHHAPPRYPRVSIRCPLTPAGLRDIHRWADQEATSLADPSGRTPPPDPRLLLTDWHDRKTGEPFGWTDGDMIACRVDEARTQPERLPPAMVGFDRTATAVTGTLALNSNVPGKPEGEGSHYLLLRLRTGRHHPQFVDRIIADASPGERVLEAADYHDHSPQALRKMRVSRDDRPSKFLQGREDAIRAALSLHDHHVSKRVPLLMDRAELERLLRQLLALMDARHGRTPGPG